MEDALFRRLESFVEQGRVILFTGAGFSQGASNKSGNHLPSAAEVTSGLWKLAFPDERYDDSDLQNTFEACMLQAKKAGVSYLQSALSVDGGSLPEYYSRWFSLPWHRIYTLNIDDLPDVVNRTANLPRPLQTLSAITDPAPGSSDALQVVHLNGKLEDLPDVTFGARQYAERLAGSDMWYGTVARELSSHPILFIGTTLDEPPLWQYVFMRGNRQTRGPELRPGSLLIVPELKRARALSLHQYQIDWFKGTAESFDAEVISRLGEASSVGLSLLKSKVSESDTPIVNLSDLSTEPYGEEREFLRGREPRWSDISTGFAIERDFDREMVTRLDAEDIKLIVLTGTAGSGKSTSAMRLILHLRSRGAKCFIVNEDSDLRSFRLRRAIDGTPVDVLFMPNLDRLGNTVPGILEDLAESSPDVLIVTTARGSWYQGRGLPRFIGQREDAIEAVVPNLADDDIEGLLDALDAANRLGVLKGKTRTQQRQIFAAKCGRQLLVAMIEATSGQPFDAKIESECQELDPESALVYATVALATNFRIKITSTDLLAALGGDPATQMTLSRDLERTHLLVRVGSDNLQLRHRLIAERAINYFRGARLIETPLRGLTFALASAARPGSLRESQAGRNLIRLINHNLLIEFLRTTSDMPDKAAIRSVYEGLEELLTRDYHYWLQRGSFETEVGDLDLAHNFIEQARGLAPDDPYVSTQWAYMTLKRASRRSMDPESQTQAEAAFEELEDQIAARGRRDSYPFHIYGSQGLAWVHRAPLGPEQQRDLLQLMRSVMTEGIKLHPGNRELKTLARDVESAYLKLATV